MEQNSSRKWYIGQNEAWVGPRSEAEILKEIEDGLLSWADHVWAQGMEHKWTKICDVQEFRSHMPRPPSGDLIAEIRSSIRRTSPSASDAATPRRSVWFLQFQGSEFGPLTLDEVNSIIKSGKLVGDLYAWKEGMPSWTPIKNVPEISGPTFTAQPTEIEAPKSSSSEPEIVLEGNTRIVPNTGVNKRTSPRVALVATVRFSMAGDNRVGANRFTGVCRDLSANGMLILSNTVPGYPASLFNLEVQPASTSGLEPFATEAQVVRILPDHKGFSVRFRNLDDRTAAKIQQYLKKNS